MQKKNLSSSFPSALNEAVDLIKRNEYQKAKDICLSFLNQNPFEANQLLGIIHLHTSSFSEALNHFDHAILFNKDQPKVWSNRSLALLGLKKFDDALNSVNQALQLDPNLVDAFFNKSRIFFELGRFKEAIFFIDLFLAVNKNIAVCWTFKAGLHYRIKQYDLAISSYIRVLELDPNSIEALNNLGMVFTEQGQYEKALIYFEKVSTLQPDFYQPILNLAVTYDKIGKFDTARNYLLSAKKLNRNAPDVLLNLGIVCQKIDGCLEESLDCFSKLIDQDGKNASYYFNRGVTLERLTRLPEAIADYDKAIKLSDSISSVQPRWNRALSLLCNGDLKRGWQEYETRFELDQMENKPFHQENFHKRWNGDPNLIRGKQFLVIAEQGLGDTLQFSRYIRYLVEMGAEVSFMIQKPLIGLYQSFKYPVRLLEMTQTPPMFDYYSSLMSLPHLLGKQLSEISQIGRAHV